jgi:hypothetical protein
MVGLDRLGLVGWMRLFFFFSFFFFFVFFFFGFEKMVNLLKASISIPIRLNSQRFYIWIEKHWCIRGEVAKVVNLLEASNSIAFRPFFISILHM